MMVCRLLKTILGFIKRMWTRSICWLKEKGKYCWKKRNSSLFYQSVKVALVLLVFLFILFWFKPKTTSFYSSIEADEFDAFNGKCNTLFVDTAYTTFDLHHKTNFVLADTPRIKIDGQMYVPNEDDESSLL